jgi:sugar/nucleoside kinase (ribokinase family)
MGTYYVEFGEPRGIQVTYDRAHYCSTQLGVNDIDWELLLDTRLLHVTGIPLIQNVELLFCSQADAKRLLHCTGSTQEIGQGVLELSRARFVVVTFAEQGALLSNGSEWRQESALHAHH